MDINNEITITLRTKLLFFVLENVVSFELDKNWAVDAISCFFFQAHPSGVFEGRGEEAGQVA